MKKYAPAMAIAGVLMGIGGYWFHTRAWDAAKLVQCLPPDRSLHVYLDVGLLRAAGILDLIAGAPGVEEADYQQFVEETGFDYRRDLSAVAAAFRDGDIFYAVRGRFDRDKIAAYARNHGGNCDGIQCSLPGSTPDRTTSFYFIRGDVLALASSHGPTAGDMVAQGTWSDPPEIPAAALWVSAPPYVFADPDRLPTGTRSFLSPLAQARATYFTLGPGDGGAYALKMEVTLDRAQDAEALAERLTDVTGELNKMLRLDNLKAKEADLSGVLAGGMFQASGTTVSGTWPIARAFVESLAAGGLGE
jgi:hypothetical protein